MNVHWSCKMQIYSFIKFQVVVGVLCTNGFGEGQDVAITNILCTNSSGWRDAIGSCFSHGGRPLTHEEILTTNISEKVIFPVWTADYVVVSNMTDETNVYQPGWSICGYATITFLSSLSNFAAFNVTAVNYGNCTERKPYVCENETIIKAIIIGKLMGTFNGTFLEINMEEMTWTDANTRCNTEKRHFVRKSSLDAKIHFASVHPEVPESMELDVWIGSVGILDSSIVQNQIETDNTVKYGTFSYADGFRTTAVNQSNEFRALCGFESIKPVNETTLTDCLSGKESTNLHVADSFNSVMTGKENTNLHAADSFDSVISDMQWLVFAITISGSVLFVLTCGGVVICIYIFDQRKRRRTRCFVKTGTTDSSTQPEFLRNVDTNPVVDDHGQVDDCNMAYRQPDPQNVHRPTFAVGQDHIIQQIADNDVDEPIYDTENSENVKSEEGGQVGSLYIYDGAIDQSGELLFEIAVKCKKKS